MLSHQPPLSTATLYGIMLLVSLLRVPSNHLNGRRDKGFLIRTSPGAVVIIVVGIEVSSSMVDVTALKVLYIV